MKDMIYNSTDNVVLSFNKYNVWRWMPMSPFSENKISFECDNQRYLDAMELVKAGNESWEIRIYWDKVVMNQKEEVFTIDIKYSDSIELRESVKVTYPQKPISINDFDISLSPNQGIWGTSGDVCSLQLYLRSELKQWMFKDTKCIVQFKHSDNKGLFPLQKGDTHIFDIKESLKIEIPLQYVGYDEPINKAIIKRVFFAINGIDCPLPPEFTFYPRPYSYKAEVIGLQDRYQYGSDNRKICQIQLVRTDALSPIAESVELPSLFPNNFTQALECSQNTQDDTKWDVIVKSDTSFNILSNLNNKKISIVFGIDDECACTASFSLDSIDKGLKPNIRIEPSGGLSLYKGNKDCSFKLIVTNRCHAKVFINKIDFKAVPADLLKIKEKVSKEIPPQGELTYTVLVNTAECFDGNACISVSTSDTEPALLNYHIEIKPYSNAKISIQPTDDIPKKIIGKQYKKNDLCIRCKIGYADNSPKDCLPIDLSRIDFGENFCLAPAALKDTIIQYGDYRIVDLLLKEDRCVNEHETIGEEKPKEDGTPETVRYLQCKWKYFDQRDALKIPFIMPQTYPYDCENFKSQFPSPEEERVVPVIQYDFYEEKELNKIEKEHGVIWDLNQRMIIESPFSFSKAKLENEKNIVPGESITIYLHINKVEGINADTLNINEPVIIPFNPILKSNNWEKPVSKDTINITLEPLSTDPELRVFFRTAESKILLEKHVKKENSNESENEDLRINSSQPVAICLHVNMQDDSVKALKIGDIVLENAQKIPDEKNGKKRGIHIEGKSIGVTCGNDINFIYDEKYMDMDKVFKILNGESEKTIELYLDYKKLQNADLGQNFMLKIEFEHIEDSKPLRRELYSAEFKLELEYDFIDDIYALDLGTTGIVIAKDTGNWPECVILKDKSNNPIEKDPEILSAHTMIKSQFSNKELAPEKIDSEPQKDDTEENKQNTSKIELAPEENEYYSKLEDKDDKITDRRFRLVPSKFIIGQDHIPFLSNFYDSEEVSKTVQAFELDEAPLDLGQEGKTREEKESSISKLIAALYREIFSRCNQEVDKIKKLVVTYPNTYTIENLNRLKEILTEGLGLKLRGQISFIPESDAVAAYYFNQMILDNHSFGPDEEAVVFYDMGAGTLDLSLVSFKKADDKIIASIVNKIGIPLAGNYLDYIIYNTLLANGWLQDEAKDINGKKIADKPNAIKNLTTEIKKGFSDNRAIAEINPDWLNHNPECFKNKRDEIDKKTYQQLIGDDNISYEKFLKACSETALKCLIPVKYRNKVHKIVFSGRGSQFAPLKKAVEKELKTLMNVNRDEIIEEKLKPIENCGDFMKTCVALGALQHQTFISGDGRFQMVNKNLFSKIAVIYYGKLKDEDEKDIFDVNVEYLVNPLDPQNDWENVEVINGTRCQEFYVERTISDYVPGYDMYYIQTCLHEDDLKTLYRKFYQRDSSYKDDLNWAFVNLLFKKRVKGSQPIPIKLKISKDNKIVEREIGGDILTGQKLLENIEDNIIYKRSMWPFIVSELK